MVRYDVEAKFLKTDHEVLRRTLRKLKATRIYSSHLMTRLVFDWPNRQTDSFVRVRNEGEQSTLTYKEYENEREVKKLETTVGDDAVAVEILQQMGATIKSRQESKREEWQLDGCKIMLDEWPWLAPFIEIKGEDEAAIKVVAEKLGFIWTQKVEGSVNEAFKGEYTIPAGKYICDEPNIAFDLPTPLWLKRLKR